MKELLSILCCFLVLAMLAACSAAPAGKPDADAGMLDAPNLTASGEPAPNETETSAESPEEVNPPEENGTSEENTSPEETITPEPIAIWEGEASMEEPPEGAVVYETPAGTQFARLGRFGYQWTTRNPTNPDEEWTVCADSIAPWDASAVLPEITDVEQVRLLWQTQPTRVSVTMWYGSDLAENPNDAQQISVPFDANGMLTAPSGSAVMAVHAEWEGYGDALYAFRWVITE